jgi:hypothetical protein
MKLKLLLFFIFLVFKGQNLFAAPVITAISPSSGPVGTLITITGTGLSNPTAFTIGGTPAVIVSNTGTQLVCMVMAATTAASVNIQTAAGTASFGSFTTSTVLPPGTQQGSKVSFTGFSSLSDPTPHQYGSMVAISADGLTAVLGGSTGKVYTRNGDTWAMQAQLPSIYPVAISGDGNTISSGKAVYIRIGSSWSKQGPDLAGTNDLDEYHRQGYSVALSADGNTLIEGNPYDSPSENSLGVGAVWVFTRSNGVWTQQAKLAVNGQGFIGLGLAVSLSADGNTAALGAANARNLTDDSFVTNGIGGVYVFKRTGTAWQQNGNLLYAAAPIIQQGVSVAVSADGNTIISGGIRNNYRNGGSWIFTRVNGNWVQQGPMLQGTGGQSLTDTQGNSVSISADGNTVLVGGPADKKRTGAAWIFTRANGTWTQYGDKYTPSGASATSDVGKSVALSADGKTAILAASADSAEFGAAWFFKSAEKREMIITYPELSAVSYGMADIQTTATSSKADLPIFYSSSDTTVATITATGKIHVKKAGSTNITVTQTGNDIYADAVPVIRVFTVNKAPLTVAVDNKTLTEGFVSFTPTARYIGFVKGDTLINLTTVPVLSTTASSISPPGLYPIAANGGEAVNYEFIYSAGILTIIPKQPGPPKIISFSPSNGQIGTLVTINGSDIGHLSAFSIGGQPAIIISNTSSKLVGMVMPGAVNGPVVLTTDSGTVSSATNFTINPVTLFPVGQQGAKVSATGTVGASFLGGSVALSADGSTAIVGGNADNSGQGAAWIFVRSGDTWVQQGGKLVGTGSTANAKQGSAVALSADGNTAVVGAYDYNGGQGAAWVFVRDAGGNWSQQGDKLIGSGAIGNANQAYSVAISADGNAIVTGGYTDNNKTGAAWVFARNNGDWLQQGNKLVGTGGTGIQQQGQAVAMSADGNTLLIGAPGDGSRGAWAFSRVNNSWVQKGDKFGIGNIAEGEAVKLSADGKTAVISAVAANLNPDPSYLRSVESYQWMDGQWQFQISYNTTADKRPNPGLGVSADVQNIVFTAPASSNTASVLVLNNWKIKPDLIKDGARASDIAISADGMIAVIGNGSDNGGIGSVRFFVPVDYISFTPPRILSYGAADTALNAIGTNTSLPITYTSSNPDIVSVAGNKLHIKRVGDVNITASQADEHIAQVTGPVSIVKALLKVKADDETKIRGTENPPFTITYTGFKNGDDTTAISVKPVLSTTATLASAAGIYPITVSGGSAANYQLQYVNGTLLIKGEQYLTRFELSPSSTFTVISQTPSVTNYKTSVSANTESVTLTPFSDGTDVQKVTINGVVVAGGVPSAPVPLDSTGVTTITMVATATNGAIRTYIIEVHKDGSSNMGLKIMALADPSAPFINQSASVSSSTTSVRVYVVPEDSTTTVKVNGTLLNGSKSDPITLNAGNAATLINVQVVAQYGTTRDYVYQVNKTGSSDISMKILALADPSAPLETLPSDGAAFNRKASVSVSATAVSVYAVPNDPTTTVKVNGTLIIGSKSAPVALNAGNVPTNITVTLTSQNGTTGTYIIQVNKTGSSDVSMKILALTNPSAALETLPSEGAAFNRKATVPASVTAVSVYAVPNDAATTVKVNGIALTGTKSNPVALNAGNIPTDINVLITSQNGTTRTYVIHVNKSGTSEASLKSLEFTNLSSFVASVAEPRRMPYPNPFTDVVKLNIGNDGIGKASVEISNLSAGGKVVYTNQYNNISGVLQVNPGNLRNGVYVLKLTADNVVHVFKIVKQ